MTTTFILSADNLIELTATFDGPVNVGPWLTAVSPERDIVVICERGVEVVRIQQGMIHSAIVVLVESPATIQLLADNGIIVDHITLDICDAYPEVPPAAVWFCQVRGFGDGEPGTPFTLEPAGSGMWAHAIFQAKFAE